jgi:hypothetical protein
LVLSAIASLACSSTQRADEAESSTPAEEAVEIDAPAVEAESEYVHNAACTAGCEGDADHTCIEICNSCIDECVRDADHASVKDAPKEAVLKCDKKCSD